MSDGASYANLLGGLAKAYAANSYGSAQRDLAYADAAYERDMARQKAELILRAGQRERSAARAATAASGARVDEFSLNVEEEITMLSEKDAAMTLLSGERSAQAMELQGRMAKISGRMEAAGTLFDMTGRAYSGWRGTKGKV